MKVRFSEQARSDLKEVFDYIANDSRRHAQETRANLIVRAEELAQFPFSGRINEKFNDPNLREVISENYRLAYHIEGQIIVILTVQHTAMSQE